jgi:hypothetical protein
MTLPEVMHDLAPPGSEQTRRTPVRHAAMTVTKRKHPPVVTLNSGLLHFLCRNPATASS